MSTNEEIYAELDRLAHSPQFERSKRLVRFLRFTIEWALKRSGESPSEVIIGTNVYDRDEAFNPLVDGIVRAEAHRLRGKLKTYYEGPGRTDPIIIEYPIGSYLPVFRTGTPEFLPEGRVAEVIRARDWSDTSLGPLAQWPRTLTDCLAVNLRISFPAAICWGPEFIFLYNDAGHTLLGEDGLQWLGRPMAEFAGPNWPKISASMTRVRDGGESAYLEKVPWFFRDGKSFREEYFNISFSPIRTSSGEVSGVLGIAAEVTEAVLAARRGKTLLDLATSTQLALTMTEGCKEAARILKNNPHDIPFASIYLFDAAASRAEFCAAAGIQPGTPVSPEVIPLGNERALLTDAINSGRPQVLDIGDQFPHLPTGAWAASPSQIVVVPLRSSRDQSVFGAIVAGVDPHRPSDAAYRDFFVVAARQVSAIIRKARGFAVETQLLAEVNWHERAWTAFANYSAEGFRTRLTVVLGLMDQILLDAHMPRRRELQTARRNTLQLLNLAEGLIDLSALQSGQLQPLFQPVDLGTATGELARAFASSLSRPNLNVTVDCPPMAEQAYVDRRMWEKVILNLLMNAVEHTKSGEVGISIRATGVWVDTVVWDTGAGIPESEKSRLFDLSYSPDPAKRRSGLGMALVQQFVLRLGGRVAVESEVGSGTKFVVSIPAGRAHLRPERVAGTADSASGLEALHAYMEGALHWTTEQTLDQSEFLEGSPDAHTEWHRQELIQRHRQTILVAVSDGDLRQYLGRIAGEIYHVESVADGYGAVNALQVQRPDLLLVDTELLGLDGIAVVRAARSDPALTALPIVLISAQASEEARLRAFVAGANDYLVKPFTAMELLVHLESQLALADAQRRVAEEAKAKTREDELRRSLLQQVIDQLTVGVVVVGAPSGELIVKNRALCELFGPVLDAITQLSDIPDPFGNRPDGRPLRRADCPLVRSAELGVIVSNEELVYNLPGCHFRAIVSSSPIRSSDGTVIGAFATYSKSEQAPQIVTALKQRA